MSGPGDQPRQRHKGPLKWVTGSELAGIGGECGQAVAAREPSWTRAQLAGSLCLSGHNGLPGAGKEGTDAPSEARRAQKELSLVPGWVLLGCLLLGPPLPATPALQGTSFGFGLVVTAKLPAGLPPCPAQKRQGSAAKLGTLLR